VPKPPFNHVICCNIHLRLLIVIHDTSYLSQGYSQNFTEVLRSISDSFKDIQSSLCIMIHCCHQPAFSFPAFSRSSPPPASPSTPNSQPPITTPLPSSFQSLSFQYPQLEPPCGFSFLRIVNLMIKPLKPWIRRIQPKGLWILHVSPPSSSCGQRMHDDGRCQTEVVHPVATTPIAFSSACCRKIIFLSYWLK
jgi:hypothetical protein